MRMTDLGRQKKVFCESEGDGWYERNRAVLVNEGTRVKDDPVIASLSAHQILARSILEIGASNGWRLAALKTVYPAARFCGIEPSAQAVKDAPAGLEIVQGTVDNLPWPEKTFDLVIFGFCLYLCDRDDLFRIAAEADRVLDDGGHIIIYDFHVPNSYRNAYSHYEGLHSYRWITVGYFPGTRVTG